MTETQTVDLATWLTHIWDEEEAAAEGNGTIAWLTFREPDGTMRYTAVASGEPDDHWVVDGEERTDYASVDVVLDEREVLARVAAWKQILELHQPGKPWCEDCPSGFGYGEIVYHEPGDICLTLRLLASPYKGREGWQEAWGDE